jgi:hypothetical protein
MAGIANDVKQIRQALYGREVREAIAHGIEQCYSDVTASKTVADTAAAAANTATQNAQTATQQANQARDNAQAVADGVVNQSITAINDAAAQQRQSVNDLGDQLKSYMSEHYSETITKAEAKANRSSVSTVKHAIGADGKLILTDALNEPAKKMMIHLKPKQDLHGYDRPWIGGSGKNLLPSGIGNGSYAGLTWTTNSDGSVTLDGTTTEQVWNKLYFTKDLTLKTGTYRFLMSGASVNARMTFQIANKAENDQLFGTSGSDNTFTVTSDYVNNMVARFIVPAGKTFAKETFFPMIMIATEPNTNYEPYANVCPIEGFDVVEVVSTGKNLFLPNNWAKGSINMSGNNFASDYGIRQVDFHHIDPDADYTFSASGASDDCALFVYDKNYNLSVRFQLWSISNGNGHYASFRTPSDAAYYKVRLTGSDYRPDRNMNMQLEYGTTATDYEPYHGNTVNVNLISSAGSTVYGGTVTVNEDGSGTLVVDTCIEDMGEINWSYNDDGRFKGAMKNQIKGYGTSDARTIDFACSCYDVLSDGSPYNGALNGVIYYAATMLWTQDNRYTDSAQYKSAMSGQTVAYPLNDPVTYQLTATQIQTVIGTNHIWTDGTSLELDYHADRYGKVERLLAAFPKDTVAGDFATFTDGADGLPVESLTANIEPKQYLHGYDHPWVGGAGKNLLRSFTNNSFLVTGIRIRTLDDGSLWVSGKATDTVEASFVRVPRDTTKTYFVNGCPSGGSTSSYRIIVRLFEGNLMVGTLSDIGNGLVIPPSEQPTATEMRVGIWVNNGYTVTGMNFKPMVIVGDSAEPYEPYENICPITGWDDVWFGENLFHKKNILFGKNWINGSAINRATVFMQMKKGAKYYYRIAYRGTAWDLGMVYGENSAIGQGQTFSWNTGMSVDTLNSHTVTNTNAFLQFQWNDGGQTDPVQLTDINTWDVFISEVSDHPTSQTVPVKSISGSTVYGGKLTIKGDGSGELIVDRAMLTESSFASVVSGVSAGGLHWTDKLDLTYTIGDGNSISSHLMKKEGNAGWASKTPCYDASDGKVIRVYCKSDNVSDFRKEMAGLQICYKTTPVTYSMTTNEVFTLLGSNHIFCDAGEVTVTYHADPTLFITKKIAQALNA